MKLALGQVQTYLGDIVGSVQDHYNIANMAIKWAKQIYWFPRVHKSYINAILQSTVYNSVMSKKNNNVTHLNLKVLCSSAQCYVAAWMGGGFGGEWIHVYIWLIPFAVHLKLSQHC